MENSKNILGTYLKVIVKASPLVIFSVFVMILVAKQYIKYAKPYYQSIAMLKIDEGTAGISKSNLYEDFDLFTSPNKVMTEIEVLKSHNLIAKTIKDLNFDVDYYQLGTISTTELFDRSPFLVKYQIIDARNKYQEEFHLEINKQGVIVDKTISNQFGDTIVLNNVKFIISKNDSFLKNNPKVDLNGTYKFKLKALDQTVKEIKKYLDITAVDKNVSVIRISFKHQVPEKTTAIVNKLAENYIKDYINNRANAADKSLQFISKQLNDVTIKLTQSENKLESYKLANGIVNIRQETETGLRKLSQLKIQLTNMEMKQATLDSLDIYINSSNKNFLDLAPHFEAFVDVLYIELIKKIQGYRAKRKELLINYTIHSEDVKTLDSKLEDLIAYFKESIKNSKQNIKIQKSQIEQTIQQAEKEFKLSPTLEKNITALSREFQQMQKLYTFLSEKKSEAILAKSAEYSFHKILERANVPKNPVSPNKTLITFLCGFLGAFMGVGLFYVKQLVTGGTIFSLEEVERNFTGETYSLLANNNQNWITKLLLKKAIAKHQVLAISHLKKDNNSMGQTVGVGESFASLGWKVLVLTIDFKQEWIAGSNASNLREVIETNNVTNCLSLGENLDTIPSAIDDSGLALLNHENFPLVMDRLKQAYDIVIVNAPSITDHIETVKIASIANHTSCIAVKKKTHMEVCTSIELLKKEYSLNNISVTLKQ